MNDNYVRRFDPQTDGLMMLADAMAGGSPGAAIVASEKAGQRQLVASAVMPAQMGNRAGYEALGFVFGEPVEGDSLFVHCTLPDGWTKQGSDHDMWSYVVDEHGRRRVAVFYKAAFYDRDAFARLETPASYLRGVLYEGAEPVLDDVWLTPEIARATLDEIAAGHDEDRESAEQYATSGRDEYWSGRAAEHKADAAKARTLRDRITA
jgi:hypothetical protein